MPRFIRLRLFRLLAGTAFAVPLCAAPAGARPVWTPVFDHGALQLEIMKPALDSGPDLDALSSVSFFSFTVPVEAGVSLVGDLPLSHFDPENRSSSTTLGNPHLGVMVGPSGGHLAVELGARLPLVDRDEFYAAYYGVYADLSRWEAWMDHLVPVNLTAHVHTVAPSGFGFRFDGGPVFWISTDDDIDSEIFACYAAQVVYEGPDVRFNGGLNGRALITDDDFELDRSTSHEFGMSVCFRIQTVWPGLTIRIPLDEDLSDVIDHVVEAQVSFELE